MVTLSVIIPTYQRPEGLLRLLRSLQRQTVAPHEILVVDNADDPTVAALLTRLSPSAAPRPCYVSEPELGLMQARHRGAMVASGDVLLYLDDDETVTPEFLAAYGEHFATFPQVVAASGPVRPVWEVPPPDWLLDIVGATRTYAPLSLLDQGAMPRLSKHGVLFGGNMAIRRDTLFAAGGFNPELVGTAYVGDGEVGLYRKLWEKDGLIGYVPAAVVYHHIPAERMTPAYLRHRGAQDGAASVYADLRGTQPSRAHLLLQAAKVSVKHSLLGLGALCCWNRTHPGALDRQHRAAYRMGQLRYLLRLVVDGERRALVQRESWLGPSA